MKKVLLDTNFLLLPGQFMIDIFTQIEGLMEYPYKLCVVDKTIGEIKKIVETGNTRDKRSAKMALMLIKQKGLKTLRSFSHKGVDDLIVDKSDDDTYVATQDKGLKKRLKEKNIKVITLKQKKYLRFEG
ncbi:MAG: PIN domain-containing protein [archaeon]